MRAKHLVFAAILGMTAYVLAHNERFLIEPDHPLWARYAQYGWWMLAHGVSGACALFLAPLQFSDRLRARYTTAHHVIGYVYVAGVLVLAPLGAYVQFMAEGLYGDPRSFTVLAGADAALLVLTTAVALVFARRRRLTQHRQWMTRSYAVGLVFFEGRFILGVTGLEAAGVEMVQAIIWVCLVMAVPLADLANDWHEVRRALAAPPRRLAVGGRGPAHQAAEPSA